MPNKKAGRRRTFKLFKRVVAVNGCPRYVRNRNRITGGGISSSIDESLFMIETIVTDMTGDPGKGAEAAQHLQLRPIQSKAAVRGWRSV